VVVAGNIDPAAVRKQVATAFAALSSAVVPSFKRVADSQKHAQTAVLRKQTDQAQIVLAFRSVDLNHPDFAAASLLATILGGGMSSRLFVQLREELGAAYYVRAEQEGFLGHGLLTISAGIDKQRLDEVVSSIMGILNDIKTASVTEAELQKAKEYTMGMLRLGLESSDSLAGFYGVQILLKGKYETPEQLRRQYLNVTVADIRRLARKLLVSRRANLCVIGPFDEKELSLSL
jgi:predicted Zn-dependent peptidase